MKLSTARKGGGEGGRERVRGTRKGLVGRLAHNWLGEGDREHGLR
jgi:hypothetical protein